MAFKAGTKNDANFLRYVYKPMSDQATEVYELRECRLFVLVCIPPDLTPVDVVDGRHILFAVSIKESGWRVVWRTCEDFERMS